MGFSGLGWAGAGAGRAFGLGPTRRICFFSHFFEIFSSAKTNSRKCLQGTKNTPKIPKIPGKFPETHWDMSYPNKVFGDDEKIFKGFK
jgi:hypothetical protein